MPILESARIDGLGPDLGKRRFFTQNGAQVHFPLFLGGLVGETELAAPSNDVPLHENFWVGGLFYSGSDRSWSDLLTGYPKKASNLRVEPH